MALDTSPRGRPMSADPRTKRSHSREVTASPSSSSMETPTPMEAVSRGVWSEEVSSMREELLALRKQVTAASLDMQQASTNQGSNNSLVIAAASAPPAAKPGMAPPPETPPKLRQAEAEQERLRLQMAEHKKSSEEVRAADRPPRQLPPHTLSTHAHARCASRDPRVPYPRLISRATLSLLRPPPPSLFAGDPDGQQQHGDDGGRDQRGEE